jgi:uncharacterized protein
MAQDAILLETTPVQTRDEVIERLRAHAVEIRGYGATALYLFGSAARDELTADSDVDVFIDYAPGGDFSLIEQAGLQIYLQRLFARNVDLLTRGGLQRRLRDVIVASSMRVL